MPDRPTLTDLHLGERLVQGANSLVYRAQTSDGEPRIVKILEGEHPSPERIAWFRREYEILGQLAEVEGVVGALGLGEEQHRWFLVLEDFGATSLDRLWRGRRMPAVEVLDLALTLTATLGEIHSRRVIHKDLNPSNIVANPHTGVVKIIDFGISSVLPRERLMAQEPAHLEGTLAYMAPEQTGRTSRSVDERADFYALGATLYELLTGHVLFESDDPLEVLHGHLARLPVSPEERVPGIDPMLAAIVLRLLAKDPEDRYQSCHGLLHDLLVCQRRQRALDASGEPQGPFAVGERDVPITLRLPQKLYGREGELRELLGVFGEVTSGGRALALVAGYSGVGKTSLVRELRQPVMTRGGFFLDGKFGQLERHEPYAPWLAAFGEALRQILAMDDERLEIHRRTFLETLGRNARVMVDVLPELAWLIGETTPVSKLGALETRNRFRLTVQRFVVALARREHPLVVFLDDWQWADGASLDLLEALLGDPESGHLLVVAAYRDHEVDVDHPFHRTLERLRSSDVALHELGLHPLAGDDMTGLLAETFGVEQEAARPLAELMAAKSGGNPFFLGRLLEHLESEGMFRFDALGGAWRWDLEEVRSCAVTDNVVDLLAGNVRGLCPSCRHVLELAACVGDVFDLEILSTVAESTPQRVAADLQEALAEELIIPLDGRYRLAPQGVEGLGTVEYRFVHDRVRQAAYSLIDEAERGDVHWRLGGLLLARDGGVAEDHRLFEIADHLGYGLTHGRSPGPWEERESLARLHLRTGRRAQDAAAYGPALHYLGIGARLLSTAAVDAAIWPSEGDMREGWARFPGLCFDLFAAAAEVAFLASEADTVQHVLGVARAFIDSDLEYAQLANIEVVALFARGDLESALRVGAGALGRLGVDVPSPPDLDTVHRVVGDIDTLLEVRGTRGVLDMSPMTDPRASAAVGVLAPLLTVSAHLGKSLLYPWIAAKMVDLTLRHGSSPNSPRGFGAYGLSLTILGRVELGCTLGNLGLEIAEQLQSPAVAATALQTNFYTTPRTEPLSTVREAWSDIYASASELGDSVTAATTLLMQLVDAFLNDLHQLADLSLRNANRLRQMGLGVYVSISEFFRQMAVGLLGDAGDAADFSGLVAEIFGALESSDRVLKRDVFDSTGLIFRYVLGEGDVGAARAYASETTRGFYLEPIVLCFRSLALLRRMSPGHTHAEDLRIVEGDHAVLAGWSRDQPANFEVTHVLVEAERARVRGDATEARDLYDRSITLAHGQGFVLLEAAAHELAAAFHRSRGHTHLVRASLRESRYAYERWGALAKVQQLEADFPQELSLWAKGHGGSVSRSHSSSSGSTRPRASEALDLRAVLEASQALSGELDLDKLLTRLLSTVLASAGAERVILLLEDAGRWWVEAEGQLAPDSPEPELRVLESIPLEDHGRLLVALILRVARTGSPEVLTDASHDGPFTHDPYVEREHPRSVLCMPLLNQGRRSAILYLENNLTQGAFDPRRVELLELLAAEMAITLDNARLYRDLALANRQLEDRVAERTRDLSARNEELRQAIERLRETREQLIQREKQAALGRMTAGVAHEIRNPLNFVNNFAQLSVELTDDLREELAARGKGLDPAVIELLDDLRENASSIEGHGQRAAGIVESMLLHAPSTGQARVVTDIDHLVRQAVLLTRHGRRAQGASFDDCFEEHYGGVGSIEVHPQELSRVLLNLLENAVQAVGEKKQRSGEAYTPSIVVHTSTTDDHVRVTVRDNGPGISEQHLDRLFEPFFTTKSPGEGTGLGLSMSFDIVERHGGGLRASSEVGAYTEMTVELPR